MVRVLGLLGIIAGFMLSPGAVLAVDEQFAANVDSLDPYYLNEAADLSQYDKVLLDDLKVSYARVIAPPWYEGEDKGSRKWQLTNSDIKFLRESYREAVTEQLTENNGYPVVTEAAEGVIILDVEIISLMPYARKGEKVKTRGFGELRAQATLRDGVTGELLGIFEGSQLVGSEYQQNTRMNAENDLRSLFQVWGARMRAVMDNSRQ